MESSDDEEEEEKIQPRPADTMEEAGGADYEPEPSGASSGAITYESAILGLLDHSLRIARIAESTGISDDVRSILEVHDRFDVLSMMNEINKLGGYDQPDGDAMVTQARVAPLSSKRRFTSTTQHGGETQVRDGQFVSVLPR